MKLFRLVHKQVASTLMDNPATGCSFAQNLPFIYGYDAIPTAVLESPVYRSLAKILPVLYVVEYILPEYSPIKRIMSASNIYGDFRTSNDYLGPWVKFFLNDCQELAAAFPSKHFFWADINNYIINPNHKMFKHVKIGKIYQLARSHDNS